MREEKKSRKENYIVACEPNLEEEWTLVHDGRGVKAYPELREYVWEKVPKQLPNGPFDRIGLHRIVKNGIKPKCVMIICPGTWMNGEQLTSNPPEDWWTMYENHSLPYYLANRDFDVYAIDYRTHFVPPELTNEELTFMIDWGWEQWMSDIKEAVDLAKEISKVERIYIAGQSFGGSAAMNYASLYWEEDLKGIILLDGGTGGKFPGLETNTYNLPEEIDNMIATETWSFYYGVNPNSIFVLRYGDENPGGPVPPEVLALYPINPITGQPWNNITELLTLMIYFTWGAGGVSNLYEGYGDPKVIIHQVASFDNWWPMRLTLEREAIRDWINCPYVPYDYDDHYNEIDVPLIAFASGVMANASGLFRFIHGIANPDFTGIMLEGYGHIDVYFGDFSAQDVSLPTYEWLISHKMLVGWGLLKIDHKLHFGNLMIYINATVVNIKINSVRVAWNIIDHVFLKKLKIEVYKGENDSGRIIIAIFNIGIAIANTRNIFIIAYVV